MRHAQHRFPIDVRTGWVDYSPALRFHVSQRIRTCLAECASKIRSVTVRISDDEPHKAAQRRCEIEVMTTDTGPISASSVSVNLFTLVDRAVDSAVGKLLQRASAEPHNEPRKRIA